MELFIIIAGIFALNARTWLGKNRSYYIIDDNVRRWGYLYCVPTTSPSPEWYSTKPHPWRHLFLSITHALNVWVIHELFGWQVAALFAFSPLSVNSTAWITGGYYAVTMFLTLTAIYFISLFPGAFGLVVGATFFTAALGSTITCLGVPFIYLFGTTGFGGLVFFWPLFTYLYGKRFRTGFAIRNDGRNDKITFNKLAVMTRVMAFYIRLNLYPDKLCFFKTYGYDYSKNEKTQEAFRKFDAEFWLAFTVVATFAFVGWQFSPFGTLWFLITLAPFTQFKILGQFVAERYLYLPQLGVCMIIGNMLVGHPVLLAGVLIAYVIRSHRYIPAFRSIAALYENGIKNDPTCMSNYANLGERMLHMKQFSRARYLLEEGLKIDHNNFLCTTNMAAYWISLHSYDRALKYTELAMQDENPLAKRILYDQWVRLSKVVKELEERNVKSIQERNEPSSKKRPVSSNKMPVPAMSQ